MTDEPILPVRGYAYRDEMEIPASLVVYASDIGERVPVVVVSLTPASWRAMVERAAEGSFHRLCRALGSPVMSWEHCDRLTRDPLLKDAEATLRAALNLPDGWTP